MVKKLFSLSCRAGPIYVVHCSIGSITLIFRSKKTQTLAPKNNNKVMLEENTKMQAVKDKLWTQMKGGMEDWISKMDLMGNKTVVQARGKVKISMNQHELDAA